MVMSRPCKAHPWPESGRGRREHCRHPCSYSSHDGLHGRCHEGKGPCKGHERDGCGDEAWVPETGNHARGRLVERNPSKSMQQRARVWSTQKCSPTCEGQYVHQVGRCPRHANSHPQMRNGASSPKDCPAGCRCEARSRPLSGQLMG